MCVSAVVLLIGMVAGVVMGIRQDFLLSPAHAHLNLVGGVLLFLFGLYYRLVPAAGHSQLARIQGVMHIIGGIMFPVGIGITLLANHAYAAIPIIGSLIVLAAMALFVVIVLRTERSGTA
ncbi:hypothetical protein [Tardiphaga sp.]|uniref:hypothetical protein n=1 Tax=Tardiphaga sp. TaxID=1926292 RepID=UPI003529DDDD